MAAIEATMIYEKSKTLVDTEFLAALEEAELLPQLYTDKYLYYLASDAFSSNTTYSIGEKIPNINLGKWCQYLLFHKNFLYKILILF